MRLGNYSVITRSAHSTSETKIAGLPNFAPHWSRSACTTDRARQQAPHGRWPGSQQSSFSTTFGVPRVPGSGTRDSLPLAKSGWGRAALSQVSEARPGAPSLFTGTRIPRSGPPPPRKPHVQMLHDRALRLPVIYGRSWRSVDATSGEHAAERSSIQPFLRNEDTILHLSSIQYGPMNSRSYSR